MPVRLEEFGLLATGFVTCGFGFAVCVGAGFAVCVLCNQVAHRWPVSLYSKVSMIQVGLPAALLRARLLQVVLQEEKPDVGTEVRELSETRFAKV